MWIRIKMIAVLSLAFALGFSCTNADDVSVDGSDLSEKDTDRATNRVGSSSAAGQESDAAAKSDAEHDGEEVGEGSEADGPEESMAADPGPLDPGAGTGAGGGMAPGPMGESPGAGVAGVPACDSTIEAAAQCGDQVCPALDPFSALSCSVPCCTERDGQPVCGTRTARTGMLSSCVAPPAPDPRCPDIPIEAFAGMVLTGCCASGNVCGGISTLENTCITENAFLSLPADPPPCDGEAQAPPEPELMDADAGVAPVDDPDGDPSAG